MLDQCVEVEAERAQRYKQPFHLIARKNSAAHTVSLSTASSSSAVSSPPPAPLTHPVRRPRSPSPCVSSRARSASPPEPEVAAEGDEGTVLLCFSCNKLHTDIPRRTVRAFAQKVVLCSYVGRRCARKRRVQ